MKKVFFFVLWGIAVLPLAAQTTDRPLFVENELYVKLSSTVLQNYVKYIPNPSNPSDGKVVWEIIQANGGISMVNPFPSQFSQLQNVYKVTLKEGSDIDKLLSILKNNPSVEYAHKIPVYYISAKPLDLDEEKQWHFKAINMNRSWFTGTQMQNRTVIAVIDNGVRYTHEDLIGNVFINTNEILGDAIDNDGNGYIDDIYGWDVADRDNDPSPILPAQGNTIYQFGAHGTHVAGIMAASPDNNKGIASMGINNKVLCIKAASSKKRDGGRDADDRAIINVTDAFTYAIKMKAHVINCSFGTDIYDPTLEAVIKQATSEGIIVIAAAGYFKNNDISYPAAYDGVIAVGATDNNDKIYGSNFGTYIDLMAPGKDIFSTVSSSDNSYGIMSGSSMAAPIVSSFVGFILAQEPDKGKFIEIILKSGCDNINTQNPGFIGKIGSGRINVDKTFEFIETFTSVNQTSNTANFNVYPNPSSTEIFIPFSSLSVDNQPLHFELYNAMGSLVSSQTITSDNSAISVAQFTQGIYQISLRSQNGQHYTARLLINR